MSEQLTSQSITSTQVIGSLKEGKKLYDSFAEKFNEQYMIHGKLVQEWREYFKLNIPPDLNPRTCIEVNEALTELEDEASAMKREVEAQLTACESVANEKSNDKVADLLVRYKSAGGKVPAKEVLIAEAESSIKELRSAAIHAQLALNFMKEIQSSLTKKRKAIDSISTNLAVEAKALQQEHFITALNKKENQNY